MKKSELRKIIKRELIKETRDWQREYGLRGDIVNSWHGVIRINFSNKDVGTIMNTEKFEDLEESEQALMGRSLKRWETESGKSMSVEDFFKAVKDDLTTLNKK